MSNYYYFAIINEYDILIESQESKDDLYKIIKLILENKNQKGVYQNNILRLYYLHYEDFYFIVASDQKIQLRIYMSYLEYIKNDFFAKYVHGRLKLNKKKYKKFMSSQLDYFINSKDSDKLRGLLINVEEIKNIATNNIVKLNERGEKLQNLNNQTELLKDNSYQLYQDSDSLKCSKCRKYYLCCFPCCY